MKNGFCATERTMGNETAPKENRSEGIRACYRVTRNVQDQQVQVMVQTSTAALVATSVVI